MESPECTLQEGKNLKEKLEVSKASELVGVLEVYVADCNIFFSPCGLAFSSVGADPDHSERSRKVIHYFTPQAHLSPRFRDPRSVPLKPWAVGGGAEARSGGRKRGLRGTRGCGGKVHGREARFCRQLRRRRTEDHHRMRYDEWAVGGCFYEYLTLRVVSRRCFVGCFVCCGGIKTTRAPEAKCGSDESVYTALLE